MHSFQYQPLPRDSTDTVIRILELLPGSSPDPIQCNLRHVDLSHSPEYEALSYCWGDALDLCSITCNGVLLDIRQSLFTALVHLRLPEQARQVWADAICINQSDVDEKSHQVRVMGHIYRSAKIVDVWLGEAADGSDTVSAFVPILLDAEQKQRAENDERSIMELTATDRKKYGLPNWMDLRYLSLLLVASRPWFSRVWIIQELSLGSNIVVYCGRWHMPWNSFTQAVEWVIELGLNIFWQADDGNNEKYLKWTQQKVASGLQPRLLTLLIRHRSANASEPKDKIYAFSSLTCDSDIIEIDYRKSVEAIYTDMTIEVLKKYQDLDILSAAHLHDDNPKDLPSWVADWSIGNKVVLPLLVESGYWGSDYEAPWRASGPKMSSPVFEDGGKILKLNGLLVDEIVSCGTTLPMPELHGFQVSGLIKAWSNNTEQLGILHEWETLAEARSGKSYLDTEEAILDAYWQTTCAGMTGDGGFESGKKAFKFWDEWRTGSRWVVKFLMDTLGLNYHSWLYQILMLIYGFVMGVARGAQPQEIKFSSMMIASFGRKMIRTSKGYIGLTSHLVAVGDRVGLFQGSKIPLIVRRKDSYWQLLGESYIHGMMFGELFEEELCEPMLFC